MTRYFVLLVGAALALSVSAGCSTSAPTTSVSYNASKDRTSFQTGTMRVGRLDGGGYGGNTSILMQVNARCPGAECTAETAQLTFLLQGSASDVALSDRSISIVADGREFTRQDASQWRTREDIQQSQGRVATLRLSLSDLETMATASSLSGRLGNNRLDLGPNVQSRLQQFIQAARGVETSKDASAS